MPDLWNMTIEECKIVWHYMPMLSFLQSNSKYTYCISVSVITNWYWNVIYSINTVSIKHFYITNITFTLQ